MIVLFDKQNKVEKHVSELMKCVSQGGYILSKQYLRATDRDAEMVAWENKLRLLQGKVASLGKTNIEKHKYAALWLATTDGCVGGNVALMKLISDIAKERLKAPESCTCYNGGSCSFGSRCPFTPNPDCYPLCSFMKGKFFTEFSPGLWEWNLEYGKNNKV